VFGVNIAAYDKIVPKVAKNCSKRMRVILCLGGQYVKVIVIAIVKSDLDSLLEYGLHFIVNKSGRL